MTWIKKPLSWRLAGQEDANDAEVAVPRPIFAGIRSLIAGLRAPPAPA